MKNIFLIFSGVLILSTGALYAAKEGQQQATVRKIDVKVGSETAPEDRMDPAAAVNPIEEMEALRARVRQFFEEGLPQTLRKSPQDYLFPSQAFQPDANVEDQGDKLAITLDLPGMRKEDILVTLKNGLLTVSGKRESSAEEKKIEKGKKVYSQERFTGSFQRTFRLPVPVQEETMKAKYENGVLAVEALKAIPPPAAEAKTIPVE